MPDTTFAPLTRIDVDDAAAAREPYSNEMLTAVNDAGVRLAVMDSDFHWHKHDAEDEFFFVLDGELHIDIEGRDTVVLGPHQGLTMPRGVVHRTRAERRTTILVVEPATTVTTGD